MAIEVSPKMVAGIVIATVVLLAFIFGLTGLVKSEQTEDTASTSAQKQDQLTNEFDQYRDIVQKILDIEKQAVADKEEMLNLTQKINAEFEIVSALNAELRSNMSLLEEENLALQNDLELLQNDTNVAFVDVNQDVELLREVVDGFDFSDGNITISSNANDASDCSNSQNTVTILKYVYVNNTEEIDALQEELRKTAMKVTEIVNNLEMFNESLGQTNASFEEYRASLSAKLQNINSSINSLENKTLQLEEAQAQVVPETKQIIYLNTTGLREDIDRNEEDIADLEAIVDTFTTDTYKYDFKQISIAIGRLEDRHDGLWHHGLNGYLYQHSIGGTSWEDSRSKCQVSLADLAHVGMRDYYTRLRITYNVCQDSSGPYWIGIDDKETEGTWIWLDDVVANETTHWADGEPNNQAAARCGALVGGEYKFYLYDSECSSDYRRICEKKCC